jgi:hypothetical protein
MPTREVLKSGERAVSVRPPGPVAPHSSEPAARPGRARAVASAALLALGLAAPSAAQFLARGHVEVPFHDPNSGVFPTFRQYVLRHRVPAGLGATNGVPITLTLRDRTRPDQVCPPGPQMSNVLLTDRCAAINWPDAGAPEPLRNRILLQTASGSQTVLHMRQDESLRAQPEPPVP